jgi:pyruvate dehydrogenase E1 component
MFGFQRVGDLVWAAADSRSRGFLLGATAGRTTLSGEGLQHQDGTSHLVASTIPTCRAYDPCFGYELAVIVQDGARRMLEAQEDVFYYVTVMNENYTHPPLPEGAAEGILRGMYCLRPSPLVKGVAKRSEAGDSGPLVKGGGERSAPGDSKGGGPAQVQLLGSGAILREVIAAAERLERNHGIAANVWSVTSWTELRWDGMLGGGAAPAAVREVRPSGIAGDRPWVERCLGPTSGPIIAASDYVSAVADLIRPWVPRRYVALGTDGFGRSDTRERLRAFFGVGANDIVRAALRALE